MNKSLLRSFSSDTDHVVDIRDYGIRNGDDVTTALTAAHVAAAAASPPRTVRVPAWTLGISSRVPLLASMRGTGGNGYSSTMARTVFVPTITDGTAALRALAKTGIDLRDFAVEASVATPNPNPSGGNVQQCIGLQLGKCVALMSAATRANPCVITTKYLHGFDTGDTVTIDNVAGMTNLNGNTYTVTRISSTTFSIGVNSSAYGVYTSGGMVYPSDLGVSTAVTRGVIQHVTAANMAVNFHLSGWLNRHVGLKSFNGTLGFDGSYLNSGDLDVITENCWQAVQLLGCNGTVLRRMEDEGAGVNDMGASSTIDYCDGITCHAWNSEGTRRAPVTPWLAIGGVSFCREIHIQGGHIGAAAGSVSVALGNVTGYTLPYLESGYSVTSSTTPHSTYTPTWTGSGSNPTLGNGTLTGRYYKRGNRVTVTIQLTFGSTSNAGNGTWTFSLPYTPIGLTMGSAKILDTGTTHFICAANADTGGLTLYGNGDIVTHNNPMVWATGDTLLATVTYDAK